MHSYSNNSLFYVADILKRYYSHIATNTQIPLTWFYVPNQIFKFQFFKEYWNFFFQNQLYVDNTQPSETYTQNEMKKIIQKQTKQQCGFHLEEENIMDNSFQKSKEIFIYYDPHQAPLLTFGIDDIRQKITQKQQQINQFKIKCQFLCQNDYITEQKNRKCQDKLQIQNAANYLQFDVKEPDPYLYPFIIVKKYLKPKKRTFTKQYYEKRAKQIQKKRFYNLKKQEILEKTGKILPQKRRKWRRKKVSLNIDVRKLKKQNSLF